MAFTDTFNQDYDQLATGPNSDIQKFLDEMAYLKQEIAAYKSEMEKVKKTKNPMVAFLMLMMLLGKQGLGQLDATTAIHGGALKIQGDITKLNGDIENITNQNSKDPKLLIDVADHLDTMLNLTADPSNPSSIQDAIQKALGGAAAGALNSQFGILRGQIKYGSYKTNDPYYFDPTGADGKISSYGQLQDDLKTRGDAQQANEAEKQKTDAFNENTATTQSTNAASQEQISNDANTTKSVQAFLVDGLHSITDVQKASINAMSKG